MIEQILANPLIAATIAAALISLLFMALWSRARAKLATSERLREESDARAQELEHKYRPIIDINQALSERKRILEQAEQQIVTLRADYTAKRAFYDQLRSEVDALEDKAGLAELGMYRPVISLSSTAEYVEAIERIRAKQKAMMDAKTAIVCPTKWSVDGSEAKGRTMTDRNIRMTTRAFNNECEVLINRVSWKNYERIKERMAKSREALDRMNESNRVHISDAFLNLKIEELRLVYEDQLKRQEEQDKIREEREREREETKAQREIQAEIKRAEKREADRLEALEAARSELLAATDAEKAQLEIQVHDLEERLKKAQEAKERAISMAEQTRAGHVYIISNVGSFGDNVFKIGLTRRLEPRDRVRELGDASVPFPFDIHALVYSDDAPTLENELHAAMEDARVNRVNSRKEFYRVGGDHLKEILRQRVPNVNYLDKPQSQEYLASLSKQQMDHLIDVGQTARLPVAI